MDAPQFPAGPFVRPESIAAEDRRAWIAEIEAAPARLRAVVDALDAARLDTPYRNWTARQIVHHLADSHLHSYIRFKWTLTEASPTIKAYDEGAWSNLNDARTGPVGPSLDLLEALHRRWAFVLKSMTAQDFGRSFVHPETGETVALGQALAYYAWHGRHHTAQVRWLGSRTGG